MLLKFFIKYAATGGLRFRAPPAKRFHLKSLLIPAPTKCQLKKISETIRCQFHKTPPRQALPPILVLVVRYVAKAGAIISGRVIRKWWQKLSPEEKAKVLEQIRSKKSKIAFAGTVFTGMFFLFYLEHLVVDPITKRRKFIMLNQKQINQIAEYEFLRQTRAFSLAVVPPYHPMYRRVVRVANNLVSSNSDLKEVKEKDWTVTVIDRPEITNAFALPHGKIFVFTGMLNICTNDDQLAMVLSHEIAHSILSHVAESMSKVFLVEFILLIPTLICWTIFPDMWALFSEWVVATLSKILIHLPFSRAIEREADMVGLQMAAKSCYDVREAPVFWNKMRVVGRDAPLEWLSTHPRHKTRQMELQVLLPEALRIREMSNCPALKPKLRYW